MNNLHKTIIILVIILIYLMVLSSKYLEDLDNVSITNKQVVVITDLNLTDLSKYFDPANYSVISLTEWKKSKNPLDIFINFPNGTINNIEKEIILVENIIKYTKQTGKIINFINEKSNQ